MQRDRLAGKQPDQAYEKPSFAVEEVKVDDMAADFNPADACIIVGAVITAGVIYAAAQCGSAN